MSPRVGQSPEPPVAVHQRAGVEPTETQSLEVESTSSLGVGRQQDLEPAIHDESVHTVARDAAAETIRGLEQANVDAAAYQATSAAQTGKPAADDGHGPAGCHGARGSRVAQVLVFHRPSMCRSAVSSSAVRNR